MIKMTANNGKKWIFYGITVAPSDAAYAILQEAIDNDMVNQEYLQSRLGYRTPIIVDHQRGTVSVESW